jgi:hypothetical protein
MLISNWSIVLKRNKTLFYLILFLELCSQCIFSSGSLFLSSLACPHSFAFSLLSFVEVQFYQVSRIWDEEEATGRMQANRMRKCWNIIDPLKTHNKMLSWHSLLFQHGLQIQCSRNNPCLTSSSSRNPGLFQIFFGLVGLITFRGTGRDISDTAATGKKKIAWTDWFAKYSTIKQFHGETSISAS